MTKLKRHQRFFVEVFRLALFAFGGPSAHIAMMLKRLVEERKYLTEKELLELMALCQILPGPTSTQTITAIGYRRGGPLVALITVLIWALPAVTIMIALAFIYSSLQQRAMPNHALIFIQPIAIGFVIYASIKIVRKVLDRLGTYAIAIISLAASLLIGSPYLFPLLLLIGGVITNFMTQETEEERAFTPKKYRAKVRFLSAFVIVFILAAVLSVAFPYRIFQLFENFYRFGALVFGGGQVLIPFMLEQFVNHNQYITSEEFLTGYGFNQGLPGPVFSFAAYVGALCMLDFGSWAAIAGGIVGAVGIFLPGTLLIFFVYPLWSYLKGFPAIRKSLLGINAAAAGLIAAAAIQLVQSIHFSLLNIITILLSFLLLQFTRISAPLLIICGIGAGIIYSIIF